MRKRLATLVILAVSVSAACAARRQPATSPVASSPPAAGPASPVSGDSLATYIAKVNAMSANVRPAPVKAERLETGDPELARALAGVASLPTAAGHRAVAEAYKRKGILDAAFESYSRAVRLDPRDGAAYDGMARIWRAWGFPHLGLGDAYRAVYHTPGSPAAYNTLGILFQEMGRTREARETFARALRIEPGACYALNNLCYSYLAEGRTTEAADACRRALAVVPGLVTARQNLALAYAAQGDVESAAREMLADPDPANAQYNLGILYLVTHRFDAATKSFERAATLRPSFSLAHKRAGQSRVLSARANSVGAPQ